jgi:hypothetical protein
MKYLIACWLILIALFLASCTPIVYVQHQSCVEDMKREAACRYLDGRDGLRQLYERLERIERIERDRNE